MPNVDLRPRLLAGKLKFPTSGRYNVRFRTPQRKTRTAVVLGAGTASGIKIKVSSNPQTQIVDNVPQCTAHNQTGCYVYR